MSDIAVVILTFNEEIHLARALESIARFAKDVIVVDSFSTDKTVEIAKAHGAVVLQNPFVNQAKQFQWAMDNVPISASWVMRLDADEIIEADLAEKIEREVSSLPADVTGIYLKRKTNFLGHFIRYGGRYPITLLRIWRRGKAQIENRWMDEHVLLLEGRAVTFEGGFVDDNLHDLTYFTAKHNGYATREAIEIVNRRHGLNLSGVEADIGHVAAQSGLKRLLKYKVFNRLPFEIAALSYFLYRYVFRLGFLDGRYGLWYHFLQGFWYRFLVGAKVRELEKGLAEGGGLDEKKAILIRLTGYKL